MYYVIADYADDRDRQGRARVYKTCQAHTNLSRAEKRQKRKLKDRRKAIVFDETRRAARRRQSERMIEGAKTKNPRSTCMVGWSRVVRFFLFVLHECRSFLFSAFSFILLSFVVSLTLCALFAPFIFYRSSFVVFTFSLYNYI